jgi:L-aminopeptidase/D-esterase-like protein
LADRTEDTVLLRPGPLNLLTDVPGLLVGNATDETAQTGVTVVRFPGGWTAGVDVRGGGPGVRETEALASENGYAKLHAVVFSGGSVFGLGAADAVAAALSDVGEGFAVHPNTPRAPIVAGAVLYDLANDGDKAWGRCPPYHGLGDAAFEAAGEAFALGSVGAGRGARAGLTRGGLGSASLDLGDGLIVSALAVVNPVGSVFMPDGETFWAWPFEIGDEYGGRTPSGPAGAIEPMPADSRLAGKGAALGANTTLALVAVNAALYAGECKRVAMMAQDGLSRAIRPAHTPFDGDVVFAAASGEVDLGVEGRQHRIARLGSAAGDCLARAIARGVYAAR